MATFRKGSSRNFNDNRVAILDVQDETNIRGQVTGKVINLAIANDLETDLSRMIHDPELVQRKYKGGGGEDLIWNKNRYSIGQYDAMMAIANTDGTHCLN